MSKNSPEEKERMLSTEQLLLGANVPRSAASISKRAIELSRKESMHIDLRQERVQKLHCRSYDNRPLLALTCDSESLVFYTDEKKAGIKLWSSKQHGHPLMCVQDGQGRIAMFWSGEENPNSKQTAEEIDISLLVSFHDAVSGAPQPSAGDHNRSNIPLPLHEGTHLVDVFPLEDGFRLFWAERPSASMGWKGDYELISAPWFPEQGQKAFPDSLTRAYHSGESIALLSESLEGASVSIEAEDRGYSVAWRSREGSRTAIKTLSCIYHQNRFSASVEQKYVATNPKEGVQILVPSWSKAKHAVFALMLSEEVKSLDTKIPWVVPDIQAPIVTKDYALRRQPSASLFSSQIEIEAPYPCNEVMVFADEEVSEKNSSDILFEGEEKIITHRSSNGLVLAWIDKMAGHKQGYGQLRMANIPSSSEAKLIHHHAIESEKPFLLDLEASFTIASGPKESYLLWLEPEGDSRNLWCLPWGGVPEALRSGVESSAVLYPAGGGSFFLHSPEQNTIELYTIVNNTLGVSKSTTIEGRDAR